MAPFFPATNKYSYGRVAGKFQCKRLDRGAAAGLSVTDGCVIREDAPLAEELSELFGRLESSILCKQLFPFQVSSAWNVATLLSFELLAIEFFFAPCVDNLYLGTLDIFLEGANLL